MKILHFYKTYYPDEYGGVQQFISQLTDGVVAAGHESEVLALTPGETGEMQIGSSRVHRVKRFFKAASTDVSFKVLSVFEQLAKSVDLVHYHFPYPLADIAHFWSRLSKPTLVTYHSDIVVQKKLAFFYRPLMNKFLGDVSAIVSTSPDYINTSPVLQKFKSKTRCIPFGIPQTPQIDPEKVQYWKERLPKRFFLFIGAFRYYKGLEFLISAAKGFPGHIILLGDGPLKSDLLDKVISEGLINVQFLGSLPEQDKEAILSLCLALVLPSHLRSEAFGFVLLEGARHGKPLICCDIGSGMTFINIHGKTGLMVTPCDPDALRAALVTLLEDQSLADRLGVGAKHRFDELFTREKMVKTYLDLYQELVSSDGNPQ